MASGTSKFIGYKSPQWLSWPGVWMILVANASCEKRRLTHTCDVKNAEEMRNIPQRCLIVNRGNTTDKESIYKMVRCVKLLTLSVQGGWWRTNTYLMVGFDRQDTYLMTQRS